jgi:hypothetical protein
MSAWVMDGERVSLDFDWRVESNLFGIGTPSIVPIRKNDIHLTIRRTKTASIEGDLLLV